MAKLFLIAGLGADERLFRNLDLSGYDVVNATWIEPDKKDSLTTYATKLIDKYQIADGASVIGVSLGGMLTVEVAKQVQLKHTIVISSIKSGAEAPWYFNFFRYVPVYKLISGELLKRMGPVIRPLFGIFAGSNDGQVFYAMLHNSSGIFLTWAMQAVLGWNGKPAPYKVDHLIGDADLVFHQSRIKDAIIIPKGDHLMVFTRAKEISIIIRNILSQ